MGIVRAMHGEITDCDEQLAYEEFDSMDDSKQSPVKPVRPDGYAEHLSGDWKDVPDWAIRRINFLERSQDMMEKRLAPRRHEGCPDVPEHTCSTVKHCFPYHCSGTCGHNEIHVTDEEKIILKVLSEYGVSFNMNIAKHIAHIIPEAVFEFKNPKVSPTQFWGENTTNGE